MPVIIAALIGGLIQAASSMVGRVLVGLGMGVVTYMGVSGLFNQLKTAAFSYMDQAYAVPQVGQWMAILKVGTCMNILFSALLVRLTLQGLSSGAVKRWITK